MLMAGKGARSIMPYTDLGVISVREAVLARFELRLNHNMNVKMRKVRVVKDQQRHVIHLVGNPFTITLLRDGDKHLTAYSDDLGLFAAVKDLPAFMIRLLS